MQSYNLTPFALHRKVNIGSRKFREELVEGTGPLIFLPLKAFSKAIKIHVFPKEM